MSGFVVARRTLLRGACPVVRSTAVARTVRSLSCVAAAQLPPVKSMIMTRGAALSSMQSRSFTSSCARLGAAAHLQSMQIFPHKDLNHLQTEACKTYSDRKLFGTKDGSRFNWTTFGEFGDMVTKFRAVLRAHEIGVNDKVALICNNRLEWAVAYFGIMGVGAQIVPMYEAQAEKDWRYIIHDSEAKLVLVANESIFEKVSPLVNDEPFLQSVLSIDSDPQLLHSYGYWMNKV